MTVVLEEKHRTREDWLEILVERTLRDIPEHVETRTDGRVKCTDEQFHVQKRGSSKVVSFGLDDTIPLRDVLDCIPYSRQWLKRLIEETNFLEIKKEKRTRSVSTWDFRNVGSTSVFESVDGFTFLYLLVHPDTRYETATAIGTKNALGISYEEFCELRRVVGVLQCKHTSRWGYEPYSSSVEKLFRDVWRRVKEERDKKKWPRMREERCAHFSNTDYAHTGFRDFKEMYCAMYPFVLGFLRRRMSYAPDAEDLAQDTLLRAHEHIGQYKPGNFKAWIVTIAQNLSLNYRRKRERTVLRTDCFDAIHTETPEDLLLARHETARREEVMRDVLSSNTLAVVEAKYWQGLSCSEIATAFDIPIGTVLSRLYRAKNKLRPYLE